MKTFAAIAIVVAIEMAWIPAKAQEPQSKPEEAVIAPATDSNPEAAAAAPTAAPAPAPVIHHEKADQQQRNTGASQTTDKEKLRIESIVNPCHGNNQPSWCS